MCTDLDGCGFVRKSSSEELVFQPTLAFLKRRLWCPLSLHTARLNETKCKEWRMYRTLGSNASLLILPESGDWYNSNGSTLDTPANLCQKSCKNHTSSSTTSSSTTPSSTTPSSTTSSPTRLSRICKVALTNLKSHIWSFGRYLIHREKFGPRDLFFARVVTHLNRQPLSSIVRNILVIRWTLLGMLVGLRQFLEWRSDHLIIRLW